MRDSTYTQLRRTGYLRLMDYWILIPVILISMIGLFVLRKVLSSGYQDYPMIYYKQIGATLVGFLLALIIGRIEVPTLRPIAWSIYGVSLLLLLIVPFDNYTASLDKWGADAWLRLPVIGTFQPSELTKLGLAMVTAYLLESISLQRLGYAKGMLILAALYAGPLALILKQPDLGTAMVIVFMFACTVFVWGIRWRYVLIALSGAVLVLPLAWFFYLGDYQKNRILSVLYPGHNPVDAYNQLQSRLAIASGGLTGSGASQPVHVPVKETDFIFSAVAEHMGFIGTTALLVLAFFFLARCLYVASKMRSIRQSSSLMMAALTAGMAFHYIENIGMGVGLLPITGIPLPFVSQGGTAMIVNLIALGVMLNVSMDRNLLRLSK